MARIDYTALWVEPSDLSWRLDSMTKAVALAIAAETHPSIAARVLDEMTWEATELGRKNATRYRSEAALELQRSLQVGQWKRQVTHEHVHRRVDLVASLRRCETEQEVRDLLGSARGCLILSSEHALLDDTQRGWARYVGRVAVVDMATGEPADLIALAAAEA